MARQRFITRQHVHSSSILHKIQDNQKVSSFRKLINIPFSNHFPSINSIVCYFLVAVFFAFPFSFYSASRTFCSVYNPNQTDFSYYWYPEVPVPKLFVSNHNNPFTKVFLTYLLAIQLCSYILSIILARITLSQMKGNLVSPKTKALQRQFSR